MACPFSATEELFSSPKQRIQGPQRQELWRFLISHKTMPLRAHIAANFTLPMLPQNYATSCPCGSPLPSQNGGEERDRGVVAGPQVDGEAPLAAAGGPGHSRSLAAAGGPGGAVRRAPAGDPVLWGECVILLSRSRRGCFGCFVFQNHEPIPQDAGCAGEVEFMRAFRCLVAACETYQLICA